MPDTRKIKCKYCGKEVEVPSDSRTPFCSEECQRKHKSELRKLRKANKSQKQGVEDKKVETKELLKGIKQEKPITKKKVSISKNKVESSEMKEARDKLTEASFMANLENIDLDPLFPPDIWEQRPVDIYTFLFDRDYLGNAWLDSDGNRTMFPFWQQEAGKMFPLPMRSPFNIIIFSGSTGCVDKDTEFFTGSGWKKISEYQLGDKVLQWEPGEDLSRSRATLVEPLNYIKKPSSGLYQFRTTYGVDMDLSGDHRLVRVTSKGNLYESQAKEVADRINQTNKGVGDRIITSFIYEGGPGLPLSDLEIRLMVAVIADGHFRNKSNTCCINIKKLYKKERLEKILHDLGLSFTKKDFNGGFSRYYFNAPRREKVYTEFWYQANQLQLKVIADELPNWDGDIENRDNRLKKCRTKVKETADFIQFVYSSLGIRATISSRNREGESYIKKLNNRNYLRKGISYQVSPTLRTTPSLRNPHGKMAVDKVNSPDGFEYCFTVPSSYLVLRKNDKIFITGNCGKTSVMMGICFAYYLHIVLCLRDPHKYFKLADQKDIVFATINIVTKTMAYKNAWGMIHKMLINSPWFMARGAKTKKSRPEWYCTTKPVSLIYGRNADDLIGLDILVAALDEISFARNQSVERQIELATAVFNAAWERMKSRYLKFGGIFEGLMLMASSKRTDQSFLESFTKKLTESIGANQVYIIDKARWEVLPAETYSGAKFPVAVGDKFRPSQIISESEVEQYNQAGYEIIWPPVEYLSEFQRDMNNALTNIAGKSVGQISSFLPGNIIKNCIGKNPRSNLFTKSVIFSGYKDDDQYYDYVDLDKCQPEDFTLPLFVHLDASLGGDGNSISGVLADYALNQRNVEGNYSEELHYRQLFKVKIRAPQGTHTGLRKNTEFIYWLNKHFNLKGVQHDQYQCLIKGTKVLTDSGYKPIELISNCDKVLSYNIGLGQYEWVPVVNSWLSRKENTWVEVKTTAGTLECTDDHPILTNKGYIKAEEIKPFTLIRKPKGVK